MAGSYSRESSTVFIPMVMGGPKLVKKLFVKISGTGCVDSVKVVREFIPRESGVGIAMIFVSG